MAKLSCILFIDDDEDDNFFHKLVVREIDPAQEVKIAESGFEALELIRNASVQPGLIFLDINMPKMNGWEFIEEYRKGGSNKETVIIMLTTSLNPADREHAEKIPEIRDFRTKPLNAAMLREIIARYFEGKD